MSNYDVSKRFEKETLCTPDNLLISFPMFTQYDEIIFFYHTTHINENKFLLDFIDKVAYRNRYTNEIKVVQFQEQNPDYKNRMGFDIPFESKPKNDFLTIEEKYYVLHDQLLEIIFSSHLTEKYKSVLAEYIHCFYTLVPNGSLRNVYYFLAKDFFNYINQNDIV